MVKSRPAAIVTGGAKGIGRAIVRTLLAQDWRVCVVDLPDAGVRRAFPSRNRNVAVVEDDVGDEDTAKRAVATALESFGRLDGIVSNAGIMIRKPLKQLALAEWRQVIDTNLTATYLFARAGEAALRRSKGAIVTIRPPAR
jgi:NAD(P)-dependent dehydrogenase (short-subunit alcohol dehydrogenase family)